MFARVPAPVGAALFAFGIAACSYISAIPAPPGSQIHGVRIPECKPLIRVAGNQIDVLWIANNDRAHALQVGTFLAKNDFKMELSNGCLTKMDSNQDTTAVPIAFLKLLEKSLDTARGVGTAFSGQGGTTVGGLMQLYEIVFDDEGTIERLKPLIPERTFLRAPVTPPLGGGGATPAGGVKVDIK